MAASAKGRKDRPRNKNKQFMENMDNTNNYDDILAFVAPKESDSYIKVIGVGGAGCNAVNHMYRQGIVGVNFVVCNTDAQALQQSPVPVKVQLGRTKGLGAGNMPSVAQQAALERKEEIKEIISDSTHMLFVTAGMGGGTGTGAAPVVAAVAKEIELDDDVKEILVVGVVSTPFFFEGRHRLQQAQEGIKELRKYVDAIIVINNDKLRVMGKLSFADSMAKADDVLSTAVKGISEIITVHTMINVDFRDVNTVMSKSGVALMGVGKSNGENRAKEAIMAALDSPLLNDNSIEGAQSILLCVIGSEKAPLQLEEVYVVAEYVRSHVGNEVEVIFGAGAENCEEDYLQVTLVATGFNEKSYEQPARTHIAEIRTDGTEVRLNEKPMVALKASTAAESVTEIRTTPVAESAVKPTPVAGNGGQPMARAQAPTATCLAQDWFSGFSREDGFTAEPVAVEPVMAEPAVAAMQQPSPVMTVAEPMAVDTEPVAVAAPVVEPAVAAVAEAPAVMAEPAAVREVPQVAAWNGDRGFSADEIEAASLGMQRVERPAGYRPAGQMAPAYEAQTAVMDEPVETASYARHPLYQERMARMRNFRADLENKGLEGMEREPAWKRQGKSIEPSVPSSRSEMGNMMITPDGRITKNAYLHDNERVD